MKNRNVSSVPAKPPKRSRKSLLSFSIATVLAVTAATAQVASSMPGSTGTEYEVAVESWTENPLIVLPVPAPQK
ncbi:MAG: hypothetical protein AVDCRST_MAG51-3409 [uncultured Ramlibacter sp.]|uniref:Uncharacterized protein n=1 Tax=uncultured Ramlibacter sp. TaxID=260755 RepID=A0A6J4QI11_9BURK|nr:MAG: hypothetical protein AVDCRST_MAG51-3409 [uncultured Ramlibacter sp.]